MQSQKVENLLNLAMDATPEEREKSSELEVGYDPEEQEWELIIKYAGDLAEVRQIANSVTELLNGYAVITIRESLIDRLAAFSQIEYVEKPKRLYFQVLNGKRVSCIDEVQNTRLSVSGQGGGIQGFPGAIRRAEGLFGKGVLVAVIDSGIDYTLPDFRNPDGTTRIRALWDQSLVPQEGEKSPEGYAIGVEYTAEEINQELGSQQQLRTNDISGHGTAVAGIAAGSGRYVGVAPESELIIVKIGSAREGGFPRTTQLMMGVDYAVRKSLQYNMPIAINISFGNTYGSHEPYN